MDEDLKYVLEELDKAAKTHGILKVICEETGLLYQTIYNLRNKKTGSCNTITELAKFFRKEAKKRERRTRPAKEKSA